MRGTWRLAFFLLDCLPLSSQIVHFSGYGNTTDQTGGAVVELYGDNAVSRIVVGPQQAYHVGFGRIVTYGPATLTLGTSTPSLRLPTDLADTQRVVYANGALLRLGGAGKAVETFAGVSDQSLGAGDGSTSDRKPLLVSSAAVPTGKVLWQALMVSGERRSILLSTAFTLRRGTLLAFTTGMSAGKPVSRILLSRTAPSWHVEVNDTSGHLSLQPDRQLQQIQLESIGLNAAALKRFGNWLTVSGSRREYDTSTSGITGMASRSTVMEGGASARLGSFQAAVRLLASNSGTAHDRGIAWIGGWVHARSSAQAMVMQRTDLLGMRTTTLQLDAGHQFHRHMQGSLGVLLGNGTPSADAGITLAGNWGSVSINHTQTYVPFGTSTGFRRVLTLAVHLNVRNADVGVARVSATGIESAWQGSVNGYEDVDSIGSPMPIKATHTLARYRLEGTVLEAGHPVSGAAVAVGSLLVYTDSSGHWMARLNHATPVRVSLQPAEFLTETMYCSNAPAMTATPAIVAVPLTQTVERCAATVVPPSRTDLVIDPAGAHPRPQKLYAVGHFMKLVIKLRP